MARPFKEGIDYFPFDVDFLQDKKIKLIKGEFGTGGVLVVLQLLCSIYGGNGYYMAFDDDDCILLAETIGCGTDAETIRNVIHGCVRRSLFDKELFETHNILTSRGIQKRYLRALSTRKNIYIFEEYWLLDAENKEDVPVSILQKITFKTVDLQNKSISLQINSEDLQIKPTKESKEKKSKVKESKEEESKEELAVVFSTLEDCGFQLSKYIADQISDLCDSYSETWVIEAIRISASKNAKNVAYIKGILKRWESKGSMDVSKLPANNQQVSDDWDDV